jgi:hypothetical protein
VTLTEEFLALEYAARKMGLQINEKIRKENIWTQVAAKARERIKKIPSELEVMNLKEWIPSYVSWFTSEQE